MPVSPTVRRRRLIAELKRLRGDRGMTIEQVATAIGMSSATLSRIENGQSGIKTPVLRALLATYEVGGEDAAALETLSKEASERGWWQFSGPVGYSDPFKTVVGLEAEATWTSYFSGTLIFGLLQTEDYAKAVVQAIYFDAPAEEIDQIVSLRMKRQERLVDLDLSMIISEECLLRPVGGKVVMAEQIRHLIGASKERNVEIQVLSTDVGEHVGLAGGFQLIGLQPGAPEAVYVEGARWDACIEERAQLLVYMRSFDKLRALALGPGDSRTRLLKIAEDYTS